MKFSNYGVPLSPLLGKRLRAFNRRFICVSHAFHRRFIGASHALLSFSASGDGWIPDGTSLFVKTRSGFVLCLLYSGLLFSFRFSKRSFFVCLFCEKEE